MVFDITYQPAPTARIQAHSSTPESKDCVGPGPVPQRVYRIDPLADPRWRELVLSHPRGSVFQSPEWLEALHRTYGYEPVALTTSPPGGQLTNGFVFCRIKSWLTGCRLVSVPFADHCDPLVRTEEELNRLLVPLKLQVDADEWKYLGFRPRTYSDDGDDHLGIAAEYWAHRIDLAPPLEELYRGFHKNCIQRNIRRAEQQSLTYEEGGSERLLGEFYKLLVMTRRRQHLPPQPYAWFRNLIACMKEIVKIRLASKAGQPVAAILTLHYKNTLVYKYGCSDRRFKSIGGAPFLFWKAIQAAKSDGCCEFDLGRSDLDNTGLSTFKQRLGATRNPLTYWRYPKTESAAEMASHSGLRRVAGEVFGHMPAPLLRATGRLLYRHIG
jgi:Acetyltransferase (GNAT) domain